MTYAMSKYAYVIGYTPHLVGPLATSQLLVLFSIGSPSADIWRLCVGTYSGCLTYTYIVLTFQRNRGYVSPLIRTPSLPFSLMSTLLPAADI
ncbi:hypothetical protein GGR55DRAFT_630817 [Xylaria sp. FL0064]|nr:hypothetical protein GGR55DRAFT_630817 [Xylaria sp. FL0064]